MHAITINELQEWLGFQASPEAEQDRAMDRAYSEWAQQEIGAVMALPASQRFTWLVHEGELAEECPNCHTLWVEVSFEEFPDMVGTTSVTTYECCEHTESANDAIEYRNGVAVDVL